MKIFCSYELYFREYAVLILVKLGPSDLFCSKTYIKISIIMTLLRIEHQKVTQTQKAVSSCLNQLTQTVASLTLSNI